MCDAFSELIGCNGLLILSGVALLAGLVRGFAGFGSAMVFMPAASVFLSPVSAFTAMIVFDVIGPLPNVPRALRESNRREVALLALGLLVGLPFGIALLTRISAEPFRWTVALVSLGLLALLVSGWRYRRERSASVTFGTGVVGGGLSGSTGMAGAPALLLYLAGREETGTIRANMILNLLLGDVISLILLSLNDALELSNIALGLALAPTYLIGNVIGAWLFREDAERLYRALAYTVIVASALSALPVLDWVGMR